MRLDHLLSKEPIGQAHSDLIQASGFRGVRSRLRQATKCGTLTIKPALGRSPVQPSGSGTSICQASARARCWVLKGRLRKRRSFKADQSSRPCNGREIWARPYFENYTVDASIFVEQQATKCNRWMPRHQEPKKDVGTCDKPRGVGNQALIRGSPNRETLKIPESCPATSA